MSFVLWVFDFCMLRRSMNEQGRKYDSPSLLQFPSLETCKGGRHVKPSLITLDSFVMKMEALLFSECLLLFTSLQCVTS